MYKEFYQLTTAPFRLTPDPRFVFAHRSYRKAQAYMQHALDQGDGVLVITGRSGTGKTTLVEDFVSGLAPGSVRTATLVSTQLEVDDFLRMVAYSFGLKAKGLDKATLLHELENLLRHQPRALLIIDEAQNLSTAALEEVRMLTNLHARTHPLMQIFLLGQESLKKRLHSREMEQLHQRLTAACDLQPLSLVETSEYVLHRLGCAGWHGNPTISNTTFVLIHRLSQGLPRYISKLCARLFLHGAVERLNHLDTGDVLAVIEEIQEELLLPLVPKGQADTDKPLPGMRQLIESRSLPDDWMVYLTQDERSFIENTPIATQSPAKAVTLVPETMPAPASAQAEPPPPPPHAYAASQARADGTKIRSMAPLTDVYDYRFDPSDLQGAPEINRQKFGKGKAIGYGIAASAILLITFYMVTYPVRQEPPAITYNPALYRSQQPAAPSIDPDSQAETSSTEVTEAAPIMDAIEAVGLLPRKPKDEGNNRALPEESGRGAGPASGDDAQQAQDVLVAVEAVPAATATVAQADNSDGTPNALPVSELALSRDALDGAGMMADETDTGATEDIARLSETTTVLAVPQTADNEAGLEIPTSGVDTHDTDRLTATAFTSTAENELQQVTVVRLSLPKPSLVEDRTVDHAQPADEAIRQIPADTPAGQVNALVAEDLEPKVGANDQHIQQLLLLGQQALDDNRLRFPAEESAWHYFDQVLTLAPDNPYAQQGLQNIADRYARLAKDRMERQRYEKARIYINRGLGVIPGDSVLLTLQQENDKRHAELLAMQERERMLAQQAIEAEALARAASRSQAESEPEPSGLIGALKGLFDRGETQAPDQLFDANDR